MTDGLRRRIPLILKLIAHSKLMNVVSLSHGKAKERYNKTLISSLYVGRNSPLLIHILPPFCVMKNKEVNWLKVGIWAKIFVLVFKVQ